jgi:hypothetical protein
LHDTFYKTILRFSEYFKENEYNNQNFDIRKEANNTLSINNMSMLAEMRLNIALLLNKYIKKTNNLIEQNSNNLEIKNKFKQTFNFIKEFIYIQILEDNNILKAIWILCKFFYLKI